MNVDLALALAVRVLDHPWGLNQDTVQRSVISLGKRIDILVSEAVDGTAGFGRKRIARLIECCGDCDAQRLLGFHTKRDRVGSFGDHHRTRLESSLMRKNYVASSG